MKLKIFSFLILISLEATAVLLSAKDGTPLMQFNGKFFPGVDFLTLTRKLCSPGQWRIDQVMEIDPSVGTIDPSNGTYLPSTKEREENLKALIKILSHSPTLKYINYNLLNPDSREFKEAQAAAEPRDKVSIPQIQELRVWYNNFRASYSAIVQGMRSEAERRTIRRHAEATEERLYVEDHAEERHPRLPFEETGGNESERAHRRASYERRSPHERAHVFSAERDLRRQTQQRETFSPANDFNTGGND